MYYICIINNLFNPLFNTISQGVYFSASVLLQKLVLRPLFKRKVNRNPENSFTEKLWQHFDAGEHDTHFLRKLRYLQNFTKQNVRSKIVSFLFLSPFCLTNCI